jgi:uncharacterized membrane protein
VLLRAATLGLTAGLRSIVAPAILSWALSSARLRTPRRLRPATDRRVTGALLLLALLEIALDKLPFLPSRTWAPIAAWRLATGSALGGAVAESTGGPLLTGASAGAVGAAVGTYGGYAARTVLARLLPEPFPGTLEDALAVTLALRATRG